MTTNSIDALTGLLLGATVLAIGIAIGDSCKSLGAARSTVGVEALDFVDATEVAKDLLNRAAGCRVLVKGDDVVVMSTNGEPCGLPFHPNVESGHTAMAYQCGARFEVHVEQPGNVHTQTCIVAHELGHVLGLKDSSYGIMNPVTCPTPIRISDFERGFLSKKYCRDGGTY